LFRSVAKFFLVGRNARYRRVAKFKESSAFFAWNFRRNGWNFFMQFASRIRDHKSDTNAEHSCARQVDGDFAKNQNRGHAASVGKGLRGAK
jgi:hypothetical protein